MAEEFPIYVKERTYHNRGYILETPCGKLRLQVGYEDETEEKIDIILAHFGKQGTCALCSMTVITSLATGVFRHCPPDVRSLIFADAFGHKCGAGKYSCNDLVLRKLYDINTSMEERKTSGRDSEDAETE